jgi:hypothetical protein
MRTCWAFATWLRSRYWFWAVERRLSYYMFRASAHITGGRSAKTVAAVDYHNMCVWTCCRMEEQSGGR